MARRPHDAARRAGILVPALLACLAAACAQIEPPRGGPEDRTPPVLLAGLLALDSLFRGDADDGSLEQWMLAPLPLAWPVLLRTLMHWLTTALPLIVATPLLAEFMHLPHALWPTLLASLLLGTPLLSLLGAVVAALTIGMRRSGILMALLALPLYVPVLVTTM